MAAILSRAVDPYAQRSPWEAVLLRALDPVSREAPVAVVPPQMQKSIIRCDVVVHDAPRLAESRSYRGCVTVCCPKVLHRLYLLGSVDR